MRKTYFCFALIINGLVGLKAQNLPMPAQGSDLVEFAKKQSKIKTETKHAIKLWSGQANAWVNADSVHTVFENGYVLIQKNGKAKDSHHMLAASSLCIPKTNVEEVFDWSKKFGLETEHFELKKLKKQQTVDLEGTKINYFLDFKQDAQKKYKFIHLLRGSEGGSVEVRIDTDKAKRVCLTTVDNFL